MRPLFRLLTLPLMYILLLRPCAAGDAVPPVFPATLLAAPVNLSWAAAHTGYWRERGIDGFLVRGILNTLSADPEILDKTPLLDEMLEAQRTLRAAGIGRNFIHLEMDTARDWMADEDAGEAAELALRQVAAFARRTGMQGVALDVSMAHPAFDIHNETYAANMPDAQQIEKTIRSKARSWVRALLAAHPSGELIVLTDDLFAGGRLFHAFVAGLLEAPGAAPVRLHFASRSTSTVEHPAALAQAVLDARERLARLLPIDIASGWRAHFAAACVLKPLIAQPQGGFAFTQSLPRLRELVAAGKTSSAEYFLLDAPAGGWWEVLEEEAGHYASSAQGAPASVSVTPAAHPALLRFSAHTLFDAHRRVGPTRMSDGAPAFVLRENDSCSVLLWGGLSAPLRLESRSKSVEFTAIGEGSVRVLLPRDGALLAPPETGVVLLRGLPLAEWGMPAAMNAQFSPPFSAGQGVAGFEFTLENVTPIRIDGLVTFWPPGGFSTSPPSLPVHLAPGELLRHRVNLNGKRRTGSEHALNITLSLEGAGVSSRTFALQAAPALQWRARRFGRILPPALLAGGDEDYVAVASEAGDVAVYDAKGQLLWEQWPGPAPLNALLVLNDLKGSLVCVSAADAVHAFHAGGAKAWSKKLDAPITGPFQALDAGTGQENLVFATGAGVQVLDGRGESVWSRPSQWPLGHLIGATSSEGQVYLITVQQRLLESIVVCLDQRGNELWASNPHRGLAYQPVVCGDALVLILGIEIVALSLQTGGELSRIPLPLGNASVRLLGQTPNLLLLASAAQLFLLDDELRLEALNPDGLAVAGTVSPGNRPLLELAGNEWLSLDAQGGTRWHAPLPGMEGAAVTLSALKGVVARVAGDIVEIYQTGDD